MTYASCHGTKRDFRSMTFVHGKNSKPAKLLSHVSAVHMMRNGSRVNKEKERTEVSTRVQFISWEGTICPCSGSLRFLLDVVHVGVKPKPSDSRTIVGKGVHRTFQENPIFLEILINCFFFYMKWSAISDLLSHRDLTFLKPATLPLSR